MTALRFMPHGLQLQDAPRVQGSLFDTTPAPKPKCDHTSSQQQIRFDTSIDVVCTACGDVLDHLEPCKRCGIILGSALPGSRPLCVECITDEDFRDVIRRVDAGEI